ncbi:hypothetical protein Hamer_G012989 [Homarus americanus]|uniref:Uncharacterized protein n=1 Tax=Homarus americanus TaxID=6706 RepID=A0A8J5K4Q5_HOMAM|nr:hypothetical protein Hamer_G012989 [Homarus americanus]
MKRGMEQRGEGWGGIERERGRDGGRDGGGERGVGKERGK